MIQPTQFVEKQSHPFVRIAIDTIVDITLDPTQPDSSATPNAGTMTSKIRRNLLSSSWWLIVSLVVTIQLITWSHETVERMIQSRQLQAMNVPVKEQMDGSESSPLGLTRAIDYELIRLPNNSFRIFVPSTIRVDTALNANDQARIVDGMARMLSELAGGCTAYPANGYYVADSSRLIKESITILHSFLDLSSESIRTELEAMTYFLAYSLQQEAVLVQFDTDSFLLKPLRQQNKLIQLWSEGTTA